MKLVSAFLLSISLSLVSLAGGCEDPRVQRHQENIESYHDYMHGCRKGTHWRPERYHKVRDKNGWTYYRKKPGTGVCR